MNLLFGYDTVVAEWVGRMTGKPFTTFDHAFGVIDGGGTLRGGFVFTGHNGTSIELSLAGNGVATRGAMAAVISYVFDQLKCSRLQMHTRRSNKRVLRQVARLMRYEGVARSFYGREDGVCYALTTADLPAFRSKWRLK
jgi:hypothetical protein